MTKLQEILEKHEISTHELADMIGMSQNFVWCVAKGDKNMSPNMFKKVCEVIPLTKKEKDELIADVLKNKLQKFREV